MANAYEYNLKKKDFIRERFGDPWEKEENKYWENKGVVQLSQIPIFESLFL